MMNIQTKQDLINKVNKGLKVKYLFFWGHQESNNTVSKSCFSQWYDSPFEADGNRFLTAEHYMMHGKAKLFGDTHAMNKALNARTPGEAKAIGRTVNDFKDAIWNAHKFDLVVKANVAKFSNNEEMKQFLINTGTRILVEASPVDRIWGIGLAQDDDAAANPRLWKGENLLGFALMVAREQLKKTNS